MNNSSRRYDIDWLRILAFGWLIIYHIGMYYVADWGWHIKSPIQSQWLQNIMIWSNPWRMSLLFLLSGMALRLVQDKVSSGQLLKMRFNRVFLTLVFGMYLIVPPQLYFELQAKAGFSADYWQFIRFYINPNTSEYPEFQYGPAGLLTWNHLWFLAYLWVYTLIYCLLKPVLSKITLWLERQQYPIVWLVCPTVLLTVISVQLEPIHPPNHSLFDDWYNHARYFSLFIIGYVIVCNNRFWPLIVQYRRQLLVTAIMGYSMVLSGYHDLLPQWVHEHRYFAEGVEAINVWAWICTLLAYCHRYLNKPNKRLVQLNEAILPCYILHQTLIVLLAVWLSQWPIPPLIEAIIITLATFMLCVVAYHIIRTNNVTRVIFGMKRITKQPTSDTGLTSPLAEKY